MPLTGDESCLLTGDESCLLTGQGLGMSPRPGNEFPLTGQGLGMSHSLHVPVSLILRPLGVLCITETGYELSEVHSRLMAQNISLHTLLDSQDTLCPLTEVLESKLHFEG